MGRHKKEKWKIIDIDDIKSNFYEISNYGRIRNKDGKILSLYIDKDGYYKCTLYKINGKRKHFFVHRLVAMYFVPNPNNLDEVNHKRAFDKTNNYYEHLEWCNHNDNIKHSIKYKLQIPLSCSAHGMATLSNDDVHTICKLIVSGYSNKEIINYFHIIDKTERERFRGVIKHIRKGKTWRPISHLYGLS